MALSAFSVESGRSYALAFAGHHGQKNRMPLSPSPRAFVMYALGLAFLVSHLPAPTHAGDAWPGWRGPHGDGKVPEEKPPLKWDAATGVLWKTPVPGRGHSSPTVLGKQIFLAT